MRLVQKYGWRDVSALYSLDEEKARESFNPSFPGSRRHEIIRPERPLDDPADFDPDPPTRLQVVIRHNEERRLIFLTWGRDPACSNDGPADGILATFSAEIAGDLVMLRDPATVPCLIPISGYAGRVPPHGGVRDDYVVRPCRASIMTIAGLAFRWKQPNRCYPTRWCAVVTTGANVFLRPYSERMPVLLAPDQFGSWLAGTAPRNLPAPAVNVEFEVRLLPP